MRYIAVRQTNRFDKKTATLYMIGQDETSWAKKHLEDKITRKLQKKYGKGPEYRMQASVISVYPIQFVLRVFPTLRDTLRVYDEPYAAKRDQVEENKRIAASKKKVGIKFGR